jgi:hypothetical protein
MKLSAFKNALNSVESLQFVLPNGQSVPAHFHITEIGNITRHFIDCGGTERIERKVNFQLWVAGDTDHRLKSEKLLRIIELGEKQLGLGDLEIEAEYQGETIGKFAVEFNNGIFFLKSTQTACLAQDACGIPVEKQKVSLQSLGTQSDSSCCTPGSGCC